MSDDQEFAAAGRIVTEYAKAKRQLAMLDEQAVNTTRALAAIAAVLGDRETLLKAGEPGRSEAFPSPPSAEGILALVKGIRAAEAEKKRLAVRMRELGALD